MKQTYYLMIISLAFCFANSQALDSKRVAVKTNNSFKQQSDNKINLEEIKTNSEALQVNLDKQKICIDKGMIYLGNGASNVDADYCFDLLNASADATAPTDIRPTIAGLVGPTSFMTSGSNYDASYKNRLSADAKCNTAFAGSRAMTFEDLKYLSDDLAVTAYNHHNFWVYDSINVNKLAKYGNYNTKLQDCYGWAATSTSQQGTLLSIRVRSGDSYISGNINTASCDLSRRIVCVHN